MAAESIDLQHFMDVITSYKCKFCTFTCQFAQGMASHVKHVHLKQGDALPTELKLPDAEMGSIATTSTGTGPGPDNDQLETLQGNTTKDSGLVLVNQDLQGLRTASSNTEIHDMSKDAPDIAAKYAEIVQEATQCMVSDSEGTVTSQSSSEVAQATGSLEEADASLPTKEVFLCGQCGVAFASIDDCKQHMVDEHNVMLPADVESDTTTKGVATHTDASTQVVPKKRPGRKRKIKDPSAVVMVNPVLIKPDEEETEHIETENIGKRRIRVPKALKDDYCLSKRVKIRRKTREMNKPFDLKCKHSNCLARFQMFSSLRIHEACHNQEMGGFVCVECRTHFLQWRTMRVHLWKAHKIDTDLYACEFEDCNYKTDKVYKLNLHKEVHSEKRPYACNQCPKSFKQINQLRTHQIIHLGKNTDPSIDKWYTSKICKICKRSFVNVKCLNKHIEAVHSKIKPFVCQYCGHSAARKAMLQLHLRTHTGEKPFKCDQCSYTTGDHNSLRRHHMRHTGQKPYQCCYCTYACIQAISLKTHMKNKHPGSEGVFACNQCTYISVNKVSLEHHLEDHRNGLVDTTAVRSQQQRPGRIAIPPVASTSTGQQSSVQTFTVQQNEQQTPQQVTVKAPGGMEGGVQSFIANDLSTAQLIYSALSAIQQSQKDKAGEPISVDGLQATVTDNSTEGTSGHTITFHIPTAQGSTGDNPVMLLQQPVTQVDSNVQDAITVAYNTNSIQSSLNQVPVSEGGLEFSATQNEMSENEGQVMLVDKEMKADSGIVAVHSQTDEEDLLNHAATMVALRGNQEIVSLAAETAELPMKDDDAENAMETQLVQFCSDGASIIQGADGTQFLQVMTSDGQRTETLLQLAPVDGGGQVLQAVPVSSVSGTVHTSQ